MIFITYRVKLKEYILKLIHFTDRAEDYKIYSEIFN